MKKTKLFYTLCFVLLFCFGAFGQKMLEPQEYEIGPITIVGANNYDHQALKLISGLRQGNKIMIPGPEITKAIQNLWEEDLFSDVQIFLEKTIGDVAYLKIALKSRPKLSYYKFSDNVTKKEAKKIREQLNLYAGKTISENVVKTTEYIARAYYVDEGYYSASVNVKRLKDTLINNSEYFLIDVSKGKRVRIKKINFFGNKSVKARKLKKAMKDTKQFAIWRLFKHSKFSQTAYERDKKNAIQKYNEFGFRDAKIISDSVYLINNKRLGIDIHVSEGDKYYFGKITWIGNSKFRSGFLDTLLGIKYGDVYNKALLEERLFRSESGRDITSLYMDKGYLFFNLTPVEIGVTEDNRINYEMRIVEGKQARIKNIIIKGNTKTNEFVIRREIRTKPGDLFSRTDIMRTQRELAQLGYFNPQALQVKPIPNPQDGTVDIVYTVEEKSADQIQLSGGYGGGRIIGTIGLSFSNFSLRNFFKKGAWKPLPSGDGQALSLRVQSNGKFYQSYSMSFTEPWLGGKKPNALSVWINNSTYSINGLRRKDPSYSGVSITGAGVGLGRRLKWPDDYFTAYHEISYQYFDVRNYGNYFVLGNGFSNNIAYKFKLMRNSVDNPIYPRSGSQLKFSFKGTLPYSLFSKIKDYSGMTLQQRFKYNEFFKFKVTGKFFFPLSPDRKLVLMSRFGFGMMGAYSQAKGLTPFERFYLGGSGLTGMSQLDGREIIALRGYDNRAISSQHGDPLIAKFTLELRYPISLNPSATVYVLGFLEAGNTYRSWKTFNPLKLKRSAGIGVRIFLPMFGMLGLDYGFGFDMLDAHSEGYKSNNQQIMKNGYRGQFHFTIGTNLGQL